MSLALLNIQGRTPVDLATNVSTALAGLTSNYIYSVQVLTDSDSRRLSDFQAVIAYDTITAPTVTAMTCVALTGNSASGVGAAITAFVAANPSYWFAPSIFNTMTDSRNTNRAWALLLYSTSSDSQANYLDEPSLATPTWVKKTLTYTQLAAAALTNSVALFNLPAKGVIHAVRIKHSASFTGGGITAYTVSVGITGSLTKYAGAFNVFQAVADTSAGKQITGTVGTESDLTATSILATATSTTSNLNAATAGSVDIWVQISTVP